MSFYKKLEVSYDVFLPIDGDGDQRVYDYDNPDFAVKMFPIRINDADAMIEGQELGNWRANVDDSKAADIVEGAKLRRKTGGLLYEVVGYPRYNNTFKRYKLNLKESNK